jgi:hypothetical protein
LYGLEGHATLTAHLAACEECAKGLRELDRARAASAELEIPAELLANQRRKTLARLDERSRPGLGWIPATAAAVLVLTFALVYDRGAVAPTKSPKTEVTDESLLAEISAIAGAEEPRAAEPIRGLFEEIALEEAK